MEYLLRLSRTIDFFVCDLMTNATDCEFGYNQIIKIYFYLSYIKSDIIRNFWVYLLKYTPLAYGSVFCVEHS